MPGRRHIDLGRVAQRPARLATRTCPVALRGGCNTGRKSDPGGVTGSNSRVARELAALAVISGVLHVLRDIDAVGVAAGKVGAYGGGASAFFFGLTANELAALAGIVVGVLGLLVQWYFNRRRDRREHEEFIARMRQYRERAQESER